MTGYTVTCAGGSPLITASVLSEFEGENVTGVTYNALALTQKTELAIGGANGVVETWYRVGSTGTATLTASFSSGDWVGHMGAQAFCGVDQTTPLGTSVTVTSASETALSLSVTVPANGMAMGAAFVNNGAESKAFTPQSGATEEWEANAVAVALARALHGQPRATVDTWDGAGNPQASFVRRSTQLRRLRPHGAQAPWSCNDEDTSDSLNPHAQCRLGCAGSDLSRGDQWRAGLTEL